MTLDLFGGDAALSPLAIEDADLSFARQIDMGLPDYALLQELIATTPWRHEAVTVYGKRHLQPRLTAWYGDPGQSYAYSGLQLAPLPWTPTLAKLRDRVQQLAQAPFSSVLLNHYRDHRDSMGMHSDDEKELGPTPVIASLSLGATRTLVFKHKTRPELKPLRLALPSGSLLIMKGLTQQNWRHGIDKLAKPCGPRINLTFRRIVG
jgi:alkylated DNA repair dioxygenase AlkB